MNKYHKIINELLAIKEEPKQNNKASYEFLQRDLINQIKLNHQLICEIECQNISNSNTLQFFRHIIDSSYSVHYGVFKDILQLLYVKQSQMLSIVYQLIPLILRKYIQSHESKNLQLQQLAKFICTNQVPKYNRFLKEREEIQNNSFVKDLYSIHFNKEIEGHHNDKSIQAEQNQSTTMDRRAIKTILFFLVYRNIKIIRNQFLKEYLKTIYFYCGGDLKTYANISSFYLLEKKNMFNLFKYSISEQEIEWMLLTLYELSIEQNEFKFELLAAINMIYKKTANQSMFKYSEIAQSIIHLLQDEYADIFA